MNIDAALEAIRVKDALIARLILEAQGHASGKQ